MAKIPGSMDLKCWPMPMLIDLDLSMKRLQLNGSKIGRLHTERYKLREFDQYKGHLYTTSRIEQQKLDGCTEAGMSSISKKYLCTCPAHQENNLM